MNKPTPQKLSGKDLKMMREASGLTLRGLAKDLGISHTHLARIESEERSLTPILAITATKVIASHFGNAKVA